MTANTTTKDNKKDDGRVVLPSHVVPCRYDLVIEPDLESFTFRGVVDITFKMDRSQINSENSKNITLHAKELCFESAQYTMIVKENEGVVNDPQASQPEAAFVKATQITVNLKETTVQFVFEESFPEAASWIKLQIRYTGFINDKMAGFYRSPYTDVQGNTKFMASTQFEAIDARRALPCVDEPGVKAVFALTLTIPGNLDCISNMPESTVESIAPSSSSSTLSSSQWKKRVTFMDTPKMSTYLLAFCVGEFDYVQALTPRGGVLIRVYTPPGRSSSGHFALSRAVQVLDMYNDFFKIPYPLPKLDMIAIGEFAMGAMENWGLVTYREVDLLIDPATASPRQKQRVAVVVAHELAHQWFGNLVTMDWWDDLWLNEGFAMWCENWTVDQIAPEYAMWEQFTIDSLSYALKLDALKSSHPIQVQIQRAEDVDEVFDAISYDKGASVVRMIKAVLGMKHFQQGLVAYMQKYAYGNTVTRDLWAAWEEVSQMPVQEMMSSWTEQMGFPLVKVLKEDWQNDKVTLELEQSWFLSDGSELDEEGAKKKWTIPIMTCTKAGIQDDMTLMREKTATITIPLDSPSGWVKLNAGQEVFMRVLPSEEMLKRLRVGILNGDLSGIERAGLLGDIYALVKAGHMSPAALIEVLLGYQKEDTYIVWDVISAVFGSLKLVLSDDAAIFANFRSLAKKMTVPLVEKVGWTPKPSADGHLTSFLRGIMLNMLSGFAYDDEDVAKEAQDRFAGFEANPNDFDSFPSEIRASIFRIALKNGGEKEYETLKEYHKNAPNDAEKAKVLGTLGNTRDLSLKKKTLEWALSGEVKLQDVSTVLFSVGYSSAEGRELSWQFFKDNHKKFTDMFDGSVANLESCIYACAGRCSSSEKADEIDEFFKEHSFPRCTRTISQMLESIRTNAKLLDRIKESEVATDAFWSNL